MERRLTPPRRSQHAAMKDVGGNDENRDGARTAGGLASSDRPGSPPRGPRQTWDSRDRRRGTSHKTESSSHRRPRSRDRSREPPRSPIHDFARSAPDTDDLIPRYRASKGRPRDPEDRSRRRSYSRDRDNRASPAPKRQRSRSGSRAGSHRKRSRKTHSPAGRESQSHRGREDRPRHRDHRKHSPGRSSHSRRITSHADDTPSYSRHRSVSRSPIELNAAPRRPRRHSRHSPAGEGHPPSRSPSPISDRRPRSSSRRPFSPSRTNLSNAPSNTSTGNWSSADPDRSALQKRHPGSPVRERDTARRERSVEPYHSAKSDFEDDMGSRGNYRGMQNSSHSHKPHYGHDSRRYSQSPPRGVSYPNSPSQSPYPPGRSDRGGQPH
jgi:CTD kinase subunit alpha